MGNNYSSGNKSKREDSESSYHTFTSCTQFESTEVTSIEPFANEPSCNDIQSSIDFKIPDMSSPIVITPTVKQTASLIFLHGLGDTGNGWSSIFREIKKPHIKYIFPTAPVRAVTLNGGMRMTAWFDILGLNPGASQDETGLKESSQILMKLVDDEIKSGIPSERIIIGGFSQGGATALYTTLTSPHKFGGVLALSTWLPLHERFPEQMEKSTGKFETQILQCHGDSDQLVPQSWSQMSVKLMQSLGFKHVNYKVYRGLDHSSCEEEMDEIATFIVKYLK